MGDIKLSRLQGRGAGGGLKEIVINKIGSLYVGAIVFKKNFSTGNFEMVEHNPPPESRIHQPESGGLSRF